MTCTCHEPAVFGHHCPSREPPPTYATGTSITTGPAEFYIINDDGQPVHIGTTTHLIIHDEIAAYTRRITEITRACENLTQAAQNWPDPRQTTGN